MGHVTYPDGHTLLRNLRRTYPVATGGQGVRLFDEDGRQWIDGSSGAFVASIGHGVREVADAIHQQLCAVGYVNGTQFTTRVTEELADRLCDGAPTGPSRAFFVASGSEAVEAAIKLARQIQVERGQHTRGRIIARVPSYHGNTLYALSASARPHYKTFYGPMLADVVTVSSPYPYRSPVEDYQRDGAAFHAAELEQKILEVGADQIAAFIAEPVIGSSAGAAVPPAGYFQAIGDVCRRHGILFIADEVLVGVGRTGTFWASDLVDARPDIIVLGKGIAGGMAPLSAVVVRQSLVDEMFHGSGGFMHAQTYMQMPAMTAAGLATLRYIDEHGLVENARRVGEHLGAGLQSLQSLPTVGCVQGVGLVWGVEFVADKSSRAPFERDVKFCERLTSRLFDAGLIVWPNAGSADGKKGDLVMIGPPLVATTDDCDAIVRILGSVIAEFSQEVM
jgi:hypothetical protein